MNSALLSGSAAILFGASGVAILLELESRRSLILEGGAFSLLAFLATLVYRLWKKESLATLWQKLPHSMALLIALAFAVESAGYGNKAMVLLLRATFIGFTLLLYTGERLRFGPLTGAESPGRWILLAGILLPFCAGFFAWNGFLLAAAWFSYALFVLFETIRSSPELHLRLNRFDLLVFFWVFFFLCMPLWADNTQDALQRTIYNGVGLTIFLIIRMHPEKSGQQLFWIGSIYILFYIFVHMAGYLGWEHGYRVSKELKGNLITTQLAQHFMFFVPIILFLTDFSRRRERFMGLVLSGLAFVALLFTVARGSLGGLVAGAFLAAAVFAVRTLRDRKQLRVVVWGLAAGLLLVALSVGLLYANLENYFTLWTLEQRASLWHMSFKHWLETPIAGNGTFIAFNIFTRLADPAFEALMQEHAPLVAPWIEPHNLYLALLIAGGLIGFLIFVLLQSSVLWQAIRAGGNRFLLLLTAGASFFVVGLTESMISTYVPLFLLWILWSLSGAYLYKVQWEISWKTGRVRLVVFVLFLLSLPYLWGNLWIHGAQTRMARAQTDIRGLPLIESATFDPMIKVLAGRAMLALPYDWRAYQISGEARAAALRGKGKQTQDETGAREVVALYEAAIRRNSNAPFLWIRLAELIEELSGPGSALQKKAVQAGERAAARDVYGVYARAWRPVK